MHPKPNAAAEAGEAASERIFIECRGWAQSLTLVAAGALALAAESWLVYSLLEGKLALPLAASLHVGLAGGLGFWTFLRGKNNPGERLPGLLTLATATLGPLGAAGFLVAMAMYLAFKNHPTPLPELYDSIFPVVDKEGMEHLFDQLIAGGPHGPDSGSIVPFMEILGKGTEKQKQAMLVLVINHYDGKFAPVLKEALKDKDPSVRVLAAMGMTKIEHKFTQQNLNLEKSAGQASPPEGIHKNLGQLYDDYIHSGILDPLRESEFREKAIVNYTQHLSYHPEDLELRLTVNRMLLKSGKIAEAADGFEESIQNGFKTPNLLFWYFECLFRLGRFGKLREQVLEHEDLLRANQDKFPFDVMQILETWQDADKTNQSALATAAGGRREP